MNDEILNKIDRFLNPLDAYRSSVDKIMSQFPFNDTNLNYLGAEKFLGQFTSGRSLHLFNLNHSIFDQKMAAIQRLPAISAALKTSTFDSSIIDKITTQAALAGSLATDRALYGFTSYPSCVSRDIEKITNPSYLECALGIIRDSRTSLEHVLNSFAYIGSAILDDPQNFSVIAETASSLELNDIDVSKLEDELKLAETKCSTLGDKSNIIKHFISFPTAFKYLAYIFLIYCFFPQINSISANLLTPIVEGYITNSEKTDREKIKDIKAIPQQLNNFNIDDLIFITGNNVRLRSEPSTNSDIYDELALGQVATVLSKKRNWIEIMYEYDDGEIMSGWVFTRYTAKFR